MKQFVFLITVLLMVFSLAGCVSTEAPPASVDTDNTVSTSHAEETNEPQSNTNQSESPDLIQEDTSVEESGNDKEETTMKISVKSAEYEIIYELNDSQAAKDLYAQLPLTVETEPFSNNEITFYPEKLNTDNTPLSGGETGSLSYYAPWGDVVMFYAPCEPNGSLYELGTVISGGSDIEKITGNITVSVCE